MVQFRDGADQDGRPFKHGNMIELPLTPKTSAVTVKHIVPYFSEKSQRFLTTDFFLSKGRLQFLFTVRDGSFHIINLGFKPRTRSQVSTAIHRCQAAGWPSKPGTQHIDMNKYIYIYIYIYNMTQQKKKRPLTSLILLSSLTYDISHRKNTNL